MFVVVLFFFVILITSHVVHIINIFGMPCNLLFFLIARHGVPGKRTAIGRPWEWDAELGRKGKHSSPVIGLRCSEPVPLDCELGQCFSLPYPSPPPPSGKTGWLERVEAGCFDSSVS